jgi:hypothetical protein
MGGIKRLSLYLQTAVIFRIPWVIQGTRHPRILEITFYRILSGKTLVGGTGLS